MCLFGLGDVAIRVQTPRNEPLVEAAARSFSGGAGS